jgi:hypothetical protein
LFLPPEVTTLTERDPPTQITHYLQDNLATLGETSQAMAAETLADGLQIR